jgi:hypothetical protein
MTKPNLSAMRSAFPDWPDELVVAKSPSNWMTMAQSFFLAADVLYQEQLSGSVDFHKNVGQPFDPEHWKRLQTAPAQFFCMSFALELAVKAALVAQCYLSKLESGDRLPFSVHNLVALASQVDGITLSPDEMECLERSAELISNGKYPVGLRPDENISGVPVSISFGDYARVVAPLYQRFMQVATHSCT